MFSNNIKFLPKRPGERYASALTNMSLTNKLINDMEKNLSDYINEFKKNLINHKKNNLDEKVIHDFGNEWNEFSQINLKEDELLSNFLQYFNIFPISELNNQMEGFDLGCGSEGGQS